MNEEIATSTADQWIKLVLQHQPEAAQAFAEALCAFRQKAVELLKQQPQ